MSGPPVDLPMQDKAIQALPEDMRKDLATGALSNLFIFNKGVLGFKDLTKACHGPLCTFHDSNPSRFKLTLIPRGHLKTSCITIGKNLQMVARNPEIRLLIANETSTNAERFLGAIKAIVETNRLFRTLYSHILPRGSRPQRWSQSELLFNRQGSYPEPTIDSIGMTGAYTSRHYNHLSLDDLISEEAAGSELVMEDVINRVGKLFSLMIEPDVDTMDVTGTRWAFYDVYAYVMGWLGKELARFIRAAIEDGKPIWPERFSLERLAVIRNDPKMGEYNFSCLYMNNPRDVAQQNFNVKDIRFWRWTADEERIALYDANGVVHKIVDLNKLDIVTTVDSRYGEELNSDRDAVVTTGCTDDGDAIVLDAWASRSNPLEVVAQLVRVIKRFSPRCIGIPKVGYEMSIKWWLNAECERHNIYANVVPVKPGGKGKPHIRGLQPIAATGHLYVLPTMHTLRQELAEYPLGQYDDVADALALQTQLWRGLLSAERMARYREFEKQVLRTTTDYGVTGPVNILEKLVPDDRGHMPSMDDLGIDPEQMRYGEIQDFLLQ